MFRPRNRVAIGSDSTTRNRKKLKTRTNTRVRTAPATFLVMPRPLSGYSRSSAVSLRRRAATTPAMASSTAAPMPMISGTLTPPPSSLFSPAACGVPGSGGAVDAGAGGRRLADRLQQHVRRGRVGEHHRADLGGLADPALEPVVAVGLQVWGVPDREVPGVGVHDLYHLVDRRQTALRVEVDSLLAVEPVVLGVGPVGVVVVVARVLGVRQLAGGEVGQQGVGVDERGPTPEEAVVVAAADHLDQLALVERRRLDPDADGGHPAGVELSQRLIRLRFGVDQVAEHDVGPTAGHLPDPVAVGVQVARLVEDAVG